MYAVLNYVLIVVHEDLAVWLYTHFVIHLVLIIQWDDFFCPLPSLSQELKPSKSLYCLRVAVYRFYLLNNWTNFYEHSYKR